MKVNELNNGFDWKATLVGETLLLGMLGKAWQADPESDWLQPLVDEDIFSQSPLETNDQDYETGLSLLQSWSHRIRDINAADRFEDLQVDYTRLFIGPGKVLAPPWESVYFGVNRSLFQQETLQVRLWYRRFGLEIEKLHKEPDDHIGMELSFIANLSQRALRALEAKDETRFSKLLEAQRQFIAEHPLQWASSWCSLVEEHSRTDFYRGLAILTRSTLLVLADVLEIPRTEMPRR
jgi:TorA maturation chaperone TorD